MELAYIDNKYLVVGYKTIYYNIYPTVVIYGMYYNMDKKNTKW